MKKEYDEDDENEEDEDDDEEDEEEDEENRFDDEEDEFGPVMMPIGSPDWFLYCLENIDTDQGIDGFRQIEKFINESTSMESCNAVLLAYEYMFPEHRKEARRLITRIGTATRRQREE